MWRKRTLDHAGPWLSSLSSAARLPIPAHPHTPTHVHTHTRAHARTRTHTRTHAHAHTHTRTQIQFVHTSTCSFPIAHSIMGLNVFYLLPVYLYDSAHTLGTGPSVSSSLYIRYTSIYTCLSLQLCVQVHWPLVYLLITNKKPKQLLDWRLQLDQLDPGLLNPTLSQKTKPPTQTNLLIAGAFNVIEAFSCRH